MKSKLMLFLAAISVAVLLSSCGQVPQKEIDAAKAIIDSAKTAGADVYAPQEIAALQDSLQKALELIEAQKQNFAPDFKEAIEKINSVIAGGSQIKGQIETRRNELKNEITNTITEVKTLQDENKKLITEAPTGKEGAQALQIIKCEADTVDMSVNEINTMLERGELIATLERAKSAKDKAISINSELKDAIAKTAVKPAGKGK